MDVPPNAKDCSQLIEHSKSSLSMRTSQNVALQQILQGTNYLAHWSFEQVTNILMIYASVQSAEMVGK